MTVLTAELYHFECDNCGHQFKTSKILAQHLMSMRSEGTGRLVVIRPWEDESALMREVSALSRALPISQGRDEYRLGGAIRSAYSVVFDPDADGSHFVVGGNPRCPRCGSNRMARWRSTDPLEFVEEDVDHPTHHEWDRLSIEEKRDRLNEAITDYLSG